MYAATALLHLSWQFRRSRGNLYRIFNQATGITQKEYFTEQLRLFKAAVEQVGQKNIIIKGDFNLDENQKYMEQTCEKDY